MDDHIITVRGSLATWRVDVNDLLSVEVDVSVCRFRFDLGEDFYVGRTLKEVHALLPDDLFVQISRKVVINKRKIKKYAKDKVYVSLELGYPVPVRNRKMVKDLIRKQ
ncbi:MAG: LytTR family transcriptional regulator DNA-binding domain-containing protein [Tannerella sp.]|jgi:DNA-binding LytR/AlgR family response regulator|nr:LytTR family transcriptional regulator DNA-binding domain-containing protein [Tannerella sp.]